MRLGWISLAATVATTAAQIGIGNKSVEKLAKPLIVAPFLFAEHKDPLFRVGCLAHMAGDIELMGADANIHRGATYFGIGHVAFLVSCLKQDKRPRLPWLYAAAVLGMAPVIKDPKLISYAAILATYASVAEPVGGTLFMISDALIELRQQHPSWLCDAAVMATYGIAQYRLLGRQLAEFLKCRNWINIAGWAKTTGWGFAVNVAVGSDITHQAGKRWRRNAGAGLLADAHIARFWKHRINWLEKAWQLNALFGGVRHYVKHPGYFSRFRACICNE